MIEKRMKSIKITRNQLEILAVVIILILGLSVFFVNRKRQATLTYENGKMTYTGTVVNNRFNGQGKLTYPNGDTYEGQFEDGVFSGQGTFKSSIGWSYVGEFKKGLADGKGVLTAKNQKVYKGTFKQGIYQK